MKRTRQLLCLVTLLLCFVVNGWAQTEDKSVTISVSSEGLTIKKTNATFTCDFFKVDFLCRSSITTDNKFQFKGDKSEYFTITPSNNYTVTKVVVSPSAYFKVGSDTEDTQIGTYIQDITKETKFSASSSSNGSTVTVESFTIYYKANGGSEQPGTTNITIGNIEDKSIPVGESYDVTNPTAVEEGTSTAVAGSFSYTTTNTDIISISGNTISGLKTGAAIVTATFTPTDGTKYNTPPTKTFTVIVTETGTSDTDVPAPSIKTLTYSTTRGIFTEENSLSNGDGIPYYGCIAVNAAYADEYGNFQDMSNKVSGLIYKFDTKTYTKEEFANHEVAGITTVSTRSALITIDGRTSEHLFLSVIAYHIKDGKRYYSDVVTRKYKYTDPGTRKELTLSCSESPFTLPLTEANKTSDEQGTLFKDIKNDVTITATAVDGSVIDLNNLSFISRSSNRKLALSHMTKEGTKETTDAGNNILLMDNGRRAGVITVLVATPGNDEYLPAFMKVNVVLKYADNTDQLGTSATKVYTSIADLRSAAVKAGVDRKTYPCVIDFSATNPATVVAKFNYEDKNIGDANSIFISDNSGYGLLVTYRQSNREMKFIDDNKLIPGSSFTGSIYAKYYEGNSNSPALKDFELSNTVNINGTSYGTNVVVDHSGEGIISSNGDVIGAYVPVTNIANVNTPNDSREETGIATAERAERPYVNTVVTIPGIIQKSGNDYFLVQQGHEVTEKKYAIFLNTTQMPDINLDNYIGLEGVITGLLSKQTEAVAKLTITRSAFFEAEELDEFILDETLPEGRVADRYNTGALSNKVNVKIHRKGWTTDTWGTICLPFDMTAAEFKATFGQGINALAKCTGTVESGALKFTVLTEKDIKAGVPYLIKVNGSITNGTGKTETDDNYYATISDRLITVPVPNVVTVDYDKNPIIGTKFEFRGLFGKKTEASETNADGTHDALAGNQKYQYISTKEGQYLHYLPAGSANGFAGLRAYLYFPEWDTELNNKTNPGTSTTNVLTINFVSDEATGISGIVADDISDGKVFNLSGQYVGNSSVGLTKGIYIRNGRKFVVK